MALAMLFYCGSAYCPQPIEDISSSKLNGTLPGYVWRGETKGFVQSTVLQQDFYGMSGYIGFNPNHNAIIVAFRGTNDLPQVLVDLEFSLEYVNYPHCDGCWVHEGFFKAEQSLIGDVQTEVQRLTTLYPDYTVYITGHSLGGAVTVLASLDLTLAGISGIQTYTFGSPRVGNDLFAQLVNKLLPNAIRVTHNKDIFPHLPFNNIMGYFHTGTEIFEDAAGKLKECTSYAEDPTCADQFLPFECNILDHHVYLGIPVDC